MITLQNHYLSAAISSHGAELKSLKNLQNGQEYMWQAGPEWEKSAPVLFPIVGEVGNNTLSINNRSYTLSRHGFARNSTFTIVSHTAIEAVFLLESNGDTFANYPYAFRFLVGFALEDDKLVTTFTVENKENGPLYFSVGAHPAFNLPGGAIENYYVEFEKEEHLRRHLLKNNLFSGETEEVPYNGTKMPLSTALFDKDAVVFKNLSSKTVSIKSRSGDYTVTMDFEGFPYFGIWTKPNCHSFLCLEPWCGLADTTGFDGDISQKEGIVMLPGGATFTRSFGVRVS